MRGSAIASIAPSTHTLESGTYVDSNATNGKSALMPGFARISFQRESALRPPRKYPGAGYSSAALTGCTNRSPVATARTVNVRLACDRILTLIIALPSIP